MRTSCASCIGTSPSGGGLGNGGLVIGVLGLPLVVIQSLTNEELVWRSVPLIVPETVPQLSGV